MYIRANAKINLTLDILNKREDGYHNIDTVMQSVSLFDEVFIEKSDRISFSADLKELCSEDNTAFIAAKHFFEFTKIKGGAEIQIKKHIPLRAGLGGPSADAAAVIIGLDRLYETNLSKEALTNIGLKVGADVPFCLFGGTARARGIGEELEKISPLKNFYTLLLRDGEKKSTAEMYKKADSEALKRNGTETFLNALYNNFENPFKFLKNDFDFDGLHNKTFELLKEFGALGSGLSGSGPFVFGIFSSYTKTQKAKEEILNQKEFEAYIAVFCEKGIIKE